ncbi:hypothetical protein C8J57DRAFT_1144126 [Mycena rebaudengoi]|nr:hypothetical protein C8J57DRAFT_1144126 [Mycena rebaudengoi]
MSYLRPSFVPVFASPSSTAVDLGTHSMIIGGSEVYLRPDEAWPICLTCALPLVPLFQLNASSRATPHEFSCLLPSVLPAGGPLTTMLQLFVCRGEEGECYDMATTYSTETRSWIVRIADVARDPADDSDSQRSAARTQIEQGEGFLPVKLVATWSRGKVETLHDELSWDQEDSEEFYAAHEPEPGLKLLGRSVRGKYYCSDECPEPGPHSTHPGIRELIQLGDRRECEWDEDEALGIMATLGNTWIEQCVDHPQAITLSMSGSW